MPKEEKINTFNSVSKSLANGVEIQLNRLFEPLGGVLPDPIENEGKNWLFLGAEDNWEVEEEDGDWGKFMSPPERQDNDTNRRYPCVSISVAGKIEKKINRIMAKDPSTIPLFKSLNLLDENGKADVSECFIAKGSGTIPDRGNSQYAVYEFVRKNGFVGEKDWPSNLEMTLEEYYRTLTPEVIAKGKKVLEYISFNYKDVSEDPDHRREALKRSPLATVVGGAYLGNEQGALLYRNNGTPSYNHQIQIYRQDRNVDISNEIIPVIDKVEDSYDPLLKDYVGTYPFKFCKIIKLKLRNMPELYKKNGEAAIYALDKEKKILVPFLDGLVSGGSFFKTVYGVDDYKLLPRKNVDILPYPVADYGLTTSKFNKAEF